MSRWCRAIELVERGCPPHLAALIVAPLDREVAVYKTPHDARRKLRRHLDEQGLSVYALLEEAH